MRPPCGATLNRTKVLLLWKYGGSSAAHGVHLEGENLFNCASEGTGFCGALVIFS